MFGIFEKNPELHKLKIQNSQGKWIDFQVELAKTQTAKEFGLMLRKSLPQKRGMFFFMSEEDKIISMWMKNTLISLDMLFIDSNMQIVDIAHKTQPLSLDLINSKFPAKYVLEINAGLCQKFKITAQGRVSFE